MSFKSSPGFPLPFGSSRHANGINFALFSRHASEISLCLFAPDGENPIVEIPLDPKINRTGDVWHIFIYDLPHDYRYGYRLNGPYDPFHGMFFDKRIIVADPYTRRIASPKKFGDMPPRMTSLGVVSPLQPFDWEGDRHPEIPLKNLIIYEMHVRGFTQDPSSKVQHPGTYLGIIEKIPYLKSLGINAIELLPIHEFNERENMSLHPKTKEPLIQYWGYSSINFFSPMQRYAVDDPIKEFKMLVKELHKNGIEVILDVVYNHTAEGNETGPTYSFRGLENRTYYMLGPNGEYYNFSGCGNTFNCNHPVVREMIRDSLRYFVTEMHVDGFRFDLASILARGHDGIPLDRPPLIDAIAHDPILAKTKLIAEAWDAGGLYQVGTFPGGDRYSEWNGKYRDDARRFIIGRDGEIGNFATRLSGSSDLYWKKGTPQNSINFITAHDGFTLYDLVSYNIKHNEENGEDNRDGSNENWSWNCGVEGPTDDPNILQLREKMMRNFLIALLISQGIPMLLSGDEYAHTKLGNNNSWAHDSRLNWFQWDTLEQKMNFFRFFQKMIEFRKSHSLFSHSHFLKEKDVIWHGKEPTKPEWGPKDHFLALALRDHGNKYMIYIAFNTADSEITFKLPHTGSHHQPWMRVVDTSKPAPDDYIDEEARTPVGTPDYMLPPFSTLILKCKL